MSKPRPAAGYAIPPPSLGFLSGWTYWAAPASLIRHCYVIFQFPILRAHVPFLIHSFLCQNNYQPEGVDEKHWMPSHRASPPNKQFGYQWTSSGLLSRTIRSDSRVRMAAAVVNLWEIGRCKCIYRLLGDRAVTSPVRFQLQPLTRLSFPLPHSHGTLPPQWAINSEKSKSLHQQYEIKHEDK